MHRLPPTRRLAPIHCRSDCTPQGLESPSGAQRTNSASHKNVLSIYDLRVVTVLKAESLQAHKGAPPTASPSWASQLTLELPYQTIGFLFDNSNNSFKRPPKVAEASEHQKCSTETVKKHHFQQFETSATVGSLNEILQLF